MPVKLYEGDKNETGGTGIEVTPNKVINLILRSLNNLIHVNDNNEVYVDLQLEDGLEDDDTLPIGVNVGRVLAADGRPVTGTLISGQTTSGDRVKVLYGDDGKIRVDNGTGEWEILAYEYHAGEGIEILNGYDYSAMQGPCPEGYHVPSENEYRTIVTTMETLGIDMSISGNSITTYLKMPYAGARMPTSGDAVARGIAQSSYWTNNQLAFAFDDAQAPTYLSWGVAFGFPVRAFKDNPIIPEQTWTTLYDGSSIASGAGIFHSAVDGVISISSDGINWITIADKNLGATVVYNVGDIETDTNCGNLYQWGNNYGFNYTGTITISSTQVDASGYGPGNYYSSSTFITVSSSPYNRSSVPNDNLWGGITGVVQIKNVINNTGVLSVEGQTGHVVLSEPDVVSITISEDNGDLRGNITSGTLKDGSPVICEFTNLTTISSITEFLLSNDTIDLIPGISSIANGDVFTGLYREDIGTDGGVFLRQKRTPTP